MTKPFSLETFVATTMPQDALLLSEPLQKAQQSLLRFGCDIAS